MGRPPLETLLKARIFVLIDNETKDKLSKCRELLLCQIHIHAM